MTHKSDLKRLIRARQAKTGESYTAARAHVLAARTADAPAPGEVDDRVRGYAVKCGPTSVRLQLFGEPGSVVTLRCSGGQAASVWPGQCVDAVLAKRWSFKGHDYATGIIERAWTDIPALGLTPLPLHDDGLLDVREHYQNYLPGEPFYEQWAALTAVPRRAFRFDMVAWGSGVGVDPDDPEADLVSDAAEIIGWDPERARALLMRALSADIRCIDAHAHLGNLVFDHQPEQARVHYEIALAIGDLSLGPDFDDLLIWGHLGNRPYHRAHLGYGLCLWRAGDLKGARRVFERSLRLNPNDNQGIRFLHEDLRKGLPYDVAAAQGGYAGATAPS